MYIQWNLHIKDTLGQLHLSFVRRLSSLGGAKGIGTIGRNYLGPQAVSCREIYCTVSLFGRVHYQRFHCNTQRSTTSVCHFKQYSLSPYAELMQRTQPWDPVLIGERNSLLHLVLVLLRMPPVSILELPLQLHKNQPKNVHVTFICQSYVWTYSSKQSYTLETRLSVHYSVVSRIDSSYVCSKCPDIE
jgi:hypothetical protein